MTALVMELVEGDDLSQRIARGAMALDEALSIAKQIAEAVEAAHEQRIIHRDLKPANIKVRGDGTVKVLDFGLAKALDGDRLSAHDMAASTTAGLATAAGVILGTAPYMSPEQAKGLPVDRRADIWAFGCVLYEMLVGRRAFDGNSLSELLAAILTRDVDFSAVPIATPARVRELLRRCLDRDPRQRLRDIGEARIVLEQPRESGPDGTARRGVAGVRWLPAGVGVGLLIGALAIAMWTRNRDAGFQAPVRLSMPLAPAERLAGDAYQRPTLRGFSIASDGQLAVFGGWRKGQRTIYRRALSEAIASPVTGSEGGGFLSCRPTGDGLASSRTTRWSRCRSTAGPRSRSALSPPARPRRLPAPHGERTGRSSSGSCEVPFGRSGPAAEHHNISPSSMRAGTRCRIGCRTTSLEREGSCSRRRRDTLELGRIAILRTGRARATHARRKRRRRSIRTRPPAVCAERDAARRPLRSRAPGCGRRRGARWSSVSCSQSATTTRW